MPIPRRLWLHLALYILTFLSTMMAGTAWAMKDFTDISQWLTGLPYALLIMTFLTAHEFGHYIAARIHGVDVSLPYFIPMPFLTVVPFGTMGAVIKSRNLIPNRSVLFDIGVAGPLAGFVVCLVILGIGIATLPSAESIYVFHPEYRLLAEIPKTGMYFGDMPLFAAFRMVGEGMGKWIPPMNEIYHYPFLCVGWFGLFVTALNMAPFGNLDGGHVLYALVGGKIQRTVSHTLWWTMVAVGTLSLLGVIDSVLQDPSPEPFVNYLQHSIGPTLHWMIGGAPWLFHNGEGWLMWALIIRFFVRIDHPEIPESEGMGTLRTTLGWMAIGILLVSLPIRLVYFVS